ncbi:hypothetical protein A2960_04205 [Candidatus Gottesmanbacteria bacterium RIFCSPLOWO2_01_FULL_39_12b]|uniref:PEGA domain-containing protein n=1 Tax=Candidatus Gottesmanbacteria bacterium RIFCSPLOWO2_01_FULL_39_12b TaxID=1798388 RepID=A0A1F6ASH6_9BACT|nr:MAG: hypothetical protein A2960_04205 [Candidatus Gottesmanbacteria bacterium RIFCSPLOWO2_01_FULL_39_12b]
MLKRSVISILIILAIAGLSLGVITYSRGYRINTLQKSLSSTGILSASSYPDKASIWIDGKLISATNSSINLSPGWYNVRISREGYQSWEKKIRIQGEIVSQLDSLLIPTNPSLRAITITGIMNPVLSPTGNKVAFIVPGEEATKSATLISKTGIWVIDLRDGLLGGKSEPKAIFHPSTRQNWTNAKLVWSPDEKYVLLIFKSSVQKKEITTAAFQLLSDSENVTAIDEKYSLPTLLAQWESIKTEKEQIILRTLPTLISDSLLNTSSNWKMSPDETKIIYLATSSANLSQIITPPLIGSNPTNETRKIEKGKYYIYDQKEDKNFYITDNKSFPNPESLIWYSDSKHIIMIEKGTISIIDYDSTNKRVVYSGPFTDNIVYSWPPGGKLVTMMNLNNQKALSNLYEIDLR